MGGFFYNPKDNKVFISAKSTFLEKEYTKNYKSERKVIIEETIREMSIPSASTVEAPVIDEILPYRRINLNTTIQRVIL